jgi:hypothetical protein
MAKKRVDPLKAKAAKQRKIAIGLSVMFLLVLAYQGPKTLKMLKPPSAPAAATDGSDPTALPAGIEATSPGVPAPTTGSSDGTPSTPTTAAGADPGEAGSESAVLANTDVPVAAGDGQLLSVEIFASKDPFQQQAKDPTAGTPAANQDVADPTVSDPNAAAGSAPGSPGTDPSIPGSAANPPISTGGIGGSGSSGSSGSGSPSVPTTPSTGPASATTISINGVVHTVTLDTEFPALPAQPLFKLVSFAMNGKSVQIGVAGGSLAGGGATVKLTVGKPLTLQNQADGSRYRLQLLTVEGMTPSSSKG